MVLSLPLCGTAIGFGFGRFLYGTKIIGGRLSRNSPALTVTVGVFVMVA